jgi:hypothetical protein
MKTAHQLARELLAGPDLPIYHFDPSRADMADEGTDPSLETPKIERVNPRDGLAKREIKDALEEGYSLKPFLTIVGDSEMKASEESGAYYEALHWLAEAAGLLSALQIRELKTMAKEMGDGRLLCRHHNRAKGDLHWDFAFGRFVELANPLYIGKPVPAGEVWVRPAKKPSGEAPWPRGKR